MPPKRTPNRPDTGDVYARPVLAALRSRTMAETMPEYENGMRLVEFDGDWAGTGSTKAGARKLHDAVIACLTAEGLPPMRSEFIPVMNGRKAAEEGNREFSMLFYFPKEQSPQVDEAVKKIAAASRALEAAAKGRSRA